MTPEEFATCWVPVPLAWRYVDRGDVIVGRNATPLLVESHGGRGGQMAVHLYGWDHPFLVDPDEVVRVLTPVPMAQAMALTRTELGARVIERRTTVEGAA
jgi:hypothetical protein